MEKNLSVFGRFKTIWISDFLKNVLLKEKSPVPTWKFWFTWNTIFALIFSFFLSIGFNTFLAAFEQNELDKIPDFEIQLQGGKFSTTIPEPFFWSNEGFVVVLNTKEVQYDKSILDDYEDGFFITKEKIIPKNEDDSSELIFSEIEKEFFLSKGNILNWFNKYRTVIKIAITLLIFFGFCFFLNIFRLITAIWWAFIFWVVGIIAGIKNFSFSTAYLAVLNLYLIPLLIEILLLTNGITIPFSTTILFLILFGMNFWNLKQEQQDSS